MELDAANEESYRSASRRNITVLGLPHELLLQVAAHLQNLRDGSLPKLACVNKRLSDIAKEAMARNLVVHQCDIKSAADWLLQNSSLIPSVTSVDLSASRTGHAPWCDDSESKNVLSPEMKAKLDKAITESTQGAVSWQGLEDFSPVEWRHPHIYDDVYPPRWDKSRWHLIDMLLCLCPNIRTVTLQMPAEKHQDVVPELSQHNRAYDLPKANDFARPVAPFEGVSLQHMRKKLKSLTIASHHRWAGLMKEEVHVRSETVHFRAYGRDVITLEGFENLRHLDIPMELLGLPYNLLFRDCGDDIPERVSVPKEFVSQSINNIKSVDLAVKILPLSLVWLQLRSCNQYLFHLLDLINDIPSGRLRLKKIDLFLDTGARESISRCTLAQSTPADFVSLLIELCDSGVNVRFYDESGNQEINMCQGSDISLNMSSELLAPAGYATPEEESVLAMIGKQFVDLNAHATASRRKSRFAHHLFMRHALSHFDLLNLPSFDANYWRGTAFFHGVSNTKFDPSLRSSKAPSAAEDYGLSSFNIAAEPRSRKKLSGHMYLDEYNFSFTSSALPPLKAPVVKVFSSLGGIYAHRMKVRRILRMMPDENSGEALQRSDPEKSRASNQKRSSRKVRKTENEEPHTCSSVNQSCMASHAPIDFKGFEVINIPHSAHFEQKWWVEVDWKDCLQPYIERDHGEK